MPVLHNHHHHHHSECNVVRYDVFIHYSICVYCVYTVSTLDMLCIWYMSVSLLFATVCMHACVCVCMWMRMRCGEQTEWSLVYNIVCIHSQYVKLFEINIRTRMNGRNERTTDRLDRQRYIIFDVFHRKFDVWKNGWDGFMRSAQLLTEKLPRNQKKHQELRKKEWNVQRIFLKNVKGRNELHTCTNIYAYMYSISPQTLLFLLPLLIFIAQCLFVSVFLPRTAHYVCMHFDSVFTRINKLAYSYICVLCNAAWFSFWCVLFFVGWTRARKERLRD